MSENKLATQDITPAEIQGEKLGKFSPKRLNHLSERSFLKLFFLFFSCSFLIAAVFMPDRAQMLTGLWKILSQPTKSSTNFFSVGGYAATFLNMGLVGLVCTGLYCLPGKKSDSAATLATILTVGFCSWGIHILNMWFGIFGVALYCLIKKEKLGNHTNTMLFSTGIAPFFSEMLLRYPNTEVIGFSVVGVVLALVTGILYGLFLPSGLDNAPKVHKGFDIYSAAVPVGMSALLLQGIFYKTVGVTIPGSVADLSVASASICNIFCLCLFGAFVVIAFLMGCRPKDYWKLLTDPEFVRDFAATYNNATMLMNVGLYGLFILGYYNLIGAPFNGVTFGIVFCMLATCNSGSSPSNIWSILLGYALASFGAEQLANWAGVPFQHALNAQSIIVGVCYANGLSPISDAYGWHYGLVASMMHYFMVTTIPSLHGSMCLYNGGFTAALVCLIMVPGLERMFRPKLERRELRKVRKEQKTS